MAAPTAPTAPAAPPPPAAPPGRPLAPHAVCAVLARALARLDPEDAAAMEAWRERAAAAAADDPALWASVEAEGNAPARQVVAALAAAPGRAAEGTASLRLRFCDVPGRQLTALAGRLRGLRELELDGCHG